MGDRGNICINYNNAYGQESKYPPIYFYGHWSGTEMPFVLQRALKKHRRWNDPAYLARIIFNELTAGYEKEETGYGIAPYICDNEHDILEVCVEEKKVKRLAYSWRKAGDIGQGKAVDGLPDYYEGNEKPIKEWTFDEFCALTEEELQKENI